MANGELQKLIGARIKRARESSGITQEDLARRLLKHKSYLSKVENGRANPTIGSLIAIAEALGIEVWELLRQEVAEDTVPGALKDLQNHLEDTGCKITAGELNFLKQLSIRGDPPKNREAYLLFWLLLRWVVGRNLPESFRLELSKTNGDLVGTFKIHME